MHKIGPPKPWFELETFCTELLRYIEMPMRQQTYNLNNNNY